MFRGMPLAVASPTRSRAGAGPAPRSGTSGGGRGGGTSGPRGSTGGPSGRLAGPRGSGMRARGGRRGPSPGGGARSTSRSRRGGGGAAASLLPPGGGGGVPLPPLQGLTFLVPEMGRGDLRLEQLDDPRGGLDLLGLDRSLHEVRGEPGLELRQARVVGGEGEELLHEPEGLVEAALHDLVLDRPPEHGEAVGEPRLHLGTAEGRTAISICRRQYVGMSGSMNSAQASIPPTRFFTLRTPSSRRKFVILADRIPDLQYTTMSSAVLSSFTRAATWPTGMRTASSRRPLSHSTR